MTGDVLARIDAALAEVDAAPAPPDDVNAYGLSWETEAGKWTAEPPVEPPARPPSSGGSDSLMVYTPAGWQDIGASIVLYAAERVAPALVSIAHYLELLNADPDSGRPSGRGMPPPLPYGRPGRAGQVSPYGPPGRTVRT